MAAECLDLQTPSPPTPGASRIIERSMCHVGKKTHMDPAFPRCCLILQVWISAGCWVRRDQAFVFTPQTTYLFDMCFHAEMITLANNLFKRPPMLLSSSVAMTVSLTPTPECVKETLQLLISERKLPYGTCQHHCISTIQSPRATCKTEIFLGFPEKIHFTVFLKGCN